MCELYKNYIHLNSRERRICCIYKIGKTSHFHFEYCALLPADWNLKLNFLDSGELSTNENHSFPRETKFTILFCFIDIFHSTQDVFENANVNRHTKYEQKCVNGSNLYNAFTHGGLSSPKIYSIVSKKQSQLCLFLSFKFVRNHCVVVFAFVPKWIDDLMTVQTTHRLTTIVFWIFRSLRGGWREQNPMQYSNCEPI